MAIVLRGKNKGKEVIISQWCNNWVSIKNSSKIYGITALKFTQEEFIKILEHDNNGGMFDFFYPDYETRTFKKRRKHD